MPLTSPTRIIFASSLTDRTSDISPVLQTEALTGPPAGLAVASSPGALYFALAWAGCIVLRVDATGGTARPLGTVIMPRSTRLQMSFDAPTSRVDLPWPATEGLRLSPVDPGGAHGGRIVSTHALRDGLRRGMVTAVEVASDSGWVLADLTWRGPAQVWAVQPDPDATSVGILVTAEVTA